MWFLWIQCGLSSLFVHIFFAPIILKNILFLFWWMFKDMPSQSGIVIISRIVVTCTYVFVFQFIVLHFSKNHFALSQFYNASEGTHVMYTFTNWRHYMLFWLSFSVCVFVVVFTHFDHDYHSEVCRMLGFLFCFCDCCVYLPWVPPTILLGYLLSLLSCPDAAGSCINCTTQRLRLWQHHHHIWLDCKFRLGCQLFCVCVCFLFGLGDSRLLYYPVREIKTWLNINHITVHNNTYCIFWNSKNRYWNVWMGVSYAEMCVATGVTVLLNDLKYMPCCSNSKVAWRQHPSPLCPNINTKQMQFM